MVKTIQIKVKTKGNCDVVNLTGRVQDALAKSQITEGAVTLFNIGSTAGITFERLAPQNARYEHEETWHDDNGHAHVRASLLGPSLTVPIVDGKLTLGTYQQIILVDFDTRPRNRTVICQMTGE